MNKHRILIEVIITNQCNKRCDYCDLDFSNNSISDDSIFLLSNFLNKSPDNIDYFHLNFFGGEPLLDFGKIKKIVSSIKIKNIKYSIGTNGNLLNNDILEFLFKNNIKINLSVDNITGFENIYNIDKKYFDIITINYINDPDFLYNSEKILLNIIDKGFKNINFMPVFSTKNWNKKNIIILGKVFNKFKSINNIKLTPFSYFNGISSDKQFILDTDGFFYNDLDSLLWLQKQYSLVDSMLRDEINKKTKNISITNNDFSFEKLLNNHKIKEVLNLVMKIPKKQGNLKNYLLFDYILKSVNK